MHVVYALEDPRDNRIWYVGQTSDVYRRFISHLRCDDDNELKNEWIDDLKTHGIVPIMRTLEKCSSSIRVIERETYWIQHYAHLNMPLTNRVNAPFTRKEGENKGEAASELVRRFILKGLSQNLIIRNVWQIKVGGRAYQKASQEFRAILASLISHTSIAVLPEKARRVAELIRQHKGQNEIISAVWGISGGGRAYQEAAQEYRAILARLLEGV